MRSVHRVGRYIAKTARAITLALCFASPLLSTACSPDILESNKAGVVSSRNTERIVELSSQFVRRGAEQDQKKEFAALAKMIALADQKDDNTLGLDALEVIINSDYFNMGMFAALKIVLENAGKDVVNATTAFRSILTNGDEDTIAAILGLPSNYKKTRDFVESLGANHEDPIVCLNFAYGTFVLDESSIAELHRKFGIVYFARYSRETLRSAHENIEFGSERDILLAILNKNDDNGAFYDRGRRLEQLTNFYKVFIVEADSERGFYIAVESVQAEHGEIKVAIIAGHGTNESILLGAQTEEGRIDLSDRDELAELRPYFARRPLVVLDSCSTGENENAIAGVISRALQARVFAPKTPNGQTNYILDSEGMIVNVTYDVSGLIFDRGEVTRVTF